MSKGPQSFLRINLIYEENESCPEVSWAREGKARLASACDRNRKIFFSKPNSRMRRVSRGILLVT